MIWCVIVHCLLSITNCWGRGTGFRIKFNIEKKLLDLHLSQCLLLNSKTSESGSYLFTIVTFLIKISCGLLVSLK